MSQVPVQTINTSGSLISSSPASFASIQVSDATIKFGLYLQKLSSLQQSLLTQTQKKCEKIVRLAYESFMKYSQNQQFSKQSYQIVKSYIIGKKSYYSLYLMDLMLKNSKYIIKQVKKQLQSMMRLVWQKVNTQHDKQQKIQNMKIMIKCWGYIYGQKVEQNIRKWLDNKYGIKKIQLTQDNDKLLKQIYGQKKCVQGNGRFYTNGQKQGRISQALMSSLIDDDNICNPSQVGYNVASIMNIGNNNAVINNMMSNNDPRLYRGTITNNSNNNRYVNSNNSSGNEVLLAKKSSSASIPNTSSSQLTKQIGNKQQSTNKKVVIQGVNKSLLQALDLN